MLAPPLPAAALITQDDCTKEDDPAVLLARDHTGVLECDAEYGVEQVNGTVIVCVALPFNPGD
jgi:hypothetical protein